MLIVKVRCERTIIGRGKSERLVNEEEVVGSGEEVEEWERLIDEEEVEVGRRCEAALAVTLDLICRRFWCRIDVQFVQDGVSLELNIY